MENILVGVIVMILLVSTTFFLPKVIGAQGETPSLKQPFDPYRHFQPENRTATPDDLIAFYWCCKKDAQGYLLQVDDDMDFSSPELETFTAESHFSISYLPDDEYYWRVKAFVASSESEWLWDGPANFITYTVFRTELDTAFDLGIIPQIQHKDTKMLCLESCTFTGGHSWNNPHQTVGCQHDNYFCARACISMVNS